MRIAHITPFYHPVVGGVEEVVKRIAEYTASRGYGVHVVTYNRLRRGGEGSLPREETINGVHVLRLEPDVVWSYGTYSSELPEVLRKLRPDIVHVHVWRHPHVFQVAKLKKRLGFKAILHTHAPFHVLSQLGLVTWLYHRVTDLLMRKTIDEYDSIIALTPLERRVLVEKLNVKARKVTVIPNGIDDELAASARSGEESSTVLYVGRISRSKNVDLLVKAMMHVEKEAPGAKLVLAGPDEGLVTRLRSYGRKHCVDFQYLGVISEDEKKKLYSRCTVFAHPALYEPFGITLLEVQAFGKPCVITGSGGQLYAAPPKRTSLHARPSPEYFGRAIFSLLSDKELYKKLSINAREWALRHMYSRILPKYREFYRKLCA